MTVTFKLDIDRVKMNHHAKHLGQMSLRKHTHKQQIDRSIGTTKVVSKHKEESCGQKRSKLKQQL